jgi:hypothetical protein
MSNDFDLGQFVRQARRKVVAQKVAATPTLKVTAYNRDVQGDELVLINPKYDSERGMLYANVAMRNGVVTDNYYVVWGSQANHDGSYRHSTAVYRRRGMKENLGFIPLDRYLKWVAEVEEWRTEAAEKRKAEEAQTEMKEVTSTQETDYSSELPKDIDPADFA